MMRRPITARAREPSSPSLGADTLRTALRLLIDGASADRFVALTGDEPSLPAVRRLAGRVAVRYTLERWWRLAGRRPAPGADRPPLGPRSGLTARQAILLSLHVGAGWGSADLGALVNADAEGIGACLAAALSRLAESSARPCVEGAALVGRYRDRDLSVDERAELLGHAARCRSCQHALARFAELDAALTAAVEATRAGLPPAPARPSLLRRALVSPSPRALALIGLAIVAVVGIAAGRSLLTGSHAAPIPLLATPATTPGSALPDGWLLYEQGNGALAAVDTASGARAPLAPPRDGSTFTQGQAYALSPDHALLASLSPNFDAGGLAPSVTLSVSRLDATGVYQHTWLQNAPTLVRLDGWLNATTVLVSVGVSGGTQLTAIDVVTQQTRVLFTGDVVDAVPSPDGTMVALTGGDLPILLGLTLDIRPVEPGGLGAPTATIDHRFPRVGRAVWSPDSRRLYLGLIADASVGASGPNAPTPQFEEPQEIVLAALTPDGTLARLTEPAAHRYDLPLAVAPDAGRVFYAREDDATTSTVTTTLRASRPDGSGGSDILTNVAWVGGPGGLPDGHSLVALAGQSYPLPLDPHQQPLGPVTLPVLYLIDGGGAAHPLRALPDTFGGDTLLQWLPRAALAPAAAATSPAPVTGQVTAPAPVSGLGTAAVAPGSAASDDGRYVVLQDRVNHTPDVWASPPEETRQLSGIDDTQLSWVPSEHVAVGVMVARPGQPPQPSRLTLLSMPPGSGPLASADSLSFDPAGVGGDLQRAYALPRVSPDGLSVAFYVVDGRGAVATLWLATAGAAPHPVTGWSVQAMSSVGSIPLTAAWATNDTLVFTEPTDWQGSLPQAIAIERLSVAPSGTTTVTRLRTLPGQGSDAAVTAAQLALSADGRYLALRVHHFGTSAPGSPATDGIEVLPTADLSQSVELARGGTGDGLTWSPGGDWLAFALDGRVTVGSPDGRTLSTVDAGQGRSDSPCWVGATRLWFAYLEPGSTATQTLQVVVR